VAGPRDAHRSAGRPDTTIYQWFAGHAHHAAASFDKRKRSWSAAGWSVAEPGLCSRG
jgi:hypothetical protein